MKKKFKAKRVTNPVKQRKLKIRKQKNAFIAKIVWLLLVLLLIGGLYLNIPRFANYFYNLTANIGLVAENITIEGQKYTDNAKLSQVLRIKPGTSIFAVSLSELKNRLELLDWVKYSIVERRLPNTIHISLVERVPVALGQKDHKLYIIDTEGEIIHEKNLKPHFKLPIIIGDGAEIYANSLINMFKTEPELFKHINAIIRVSERRWNIRFDKDLEVKMPEDKIEEAWKDVVKLYKKNALFNPAVSSIDLRIPNKIFIEKR